MERVSIALLGLKDESTNKGCEALTFSYFEMMKEVQGAEMKCFFLKKLSKKDFLTGKIKQKEKIQIDRFRSCGFEINYIYYVYVLNKIIFLNPLPPIDCCIDFTLGDSFTDLYGDIRFDILTSLKEEILRRGIPLFLGSQTIGPFKKKKNRQRASKVLNHCKAVFTRDVDSYHYVRKISGMKPILTTDVAFFLPYEDRGYQKSNRVGFNPSGLLWNGGYTKNNQFGLSIDYKDFCRRCISYAIKNGFEVHLIGHVISEDIDTIDNDCCAIRALHDEFPQTIVAPLFDTPMEAKTYISTMTAFTGARMHATIAAVSSGVPVLPFSYSRKFEGLFQTLDYKYMIHGNKESTEEAVGKFEYFINNSESIRSDILKTQRIIDQMKEKMVKDYKVIFENEKNENKRKTKV